MEVDGGAVTTLNANNYGGGFTEHLGAAGGAVGGGAAIGGAVNTSTLTAEDIHLYNRYRHFSGQEDIMGMGTMTGQGHFFSQYRAGVFDGMALSDQFLGEYYSSVSIF